MKPRTKRILGAIGIVLAGAALWMMRVPSGPVKPTGQVPVATSWHLQPVVAGLEHPWSLAWLPSGELLVTERPAVSASCATACCSLPRLRDCLRRLASATVA